MVAEQALDLQALQRSPQKTGKAQGENGRRHVAGGTLWLSNGECVG